MNKQFLTLAIAVLLGSCAKTEEILIPKNEAESEKPGSEQITYTLNADFEGNSGTRTYTEDGKKTLWSTGDKIYIGTSKTEYTLTATNTDKTTGTFSGDSEAENDAIAIYGGTVSAITESGATVTIPSSISFDKDNNNANTIMIGKVAKTDNSCNVAFKNAGAIVYIKNITGYSIVEVTSSTANIAGTATVAWNSGEPTYSITSSESKKITITNIPTSGINEVVVPLPVMSAQTEITITGTSDGATGEEIFKGKVTAKRNKVYMVDCVTKVSEEQAMETALSAGNSVKLTSDIVLTPTNDTKVTTNGATTTVLDMSDKTVTLAANTIVEINDVSATRGTGYPTVVLKNGKINSPSGTSEVNITFKVKTPCYIDFENLQVEKPTSKVTYNLTLDFSELQGGINEDDAIAYTLNNCYVENKHISMDSRLYIRKQSTSSGCNTKTYENVTINLTFKWQNN